jgi:SPRY domain
MSQLQLPTCKVESPYDSLHSFQAKMERLARDIDEIQTNSCSETPPSSDDSFDDDDWSVEVGESIPPETDQEPLCVAKESKDLGIDRTLIAGDGLQVIEAVGVDSNEVQLIQFTGRIGRESRSIRTSKPLAKPSEQFDTIRQMKPFIVPFQDTNGILSFLPRLVSYYEVEITKAPISKGDDKSYPDATNSTSSKNDPNTDKTAVWEAPCIAIGLAGVDFPVKDTMPGWKQRSFGYHSDDGTAWANQMKLTGYAKKFGVGDVVGCGIDYRAVGTVFFTLNGEFLGHASCLSDGELGMDWYPSVGLDSHDCVQCNFGFEKAFVFDLLKYCQGAPPPTSSRTMAAVTNKRSTRAVTNKKSTQKLKTRKRVAS